MRFSKEAVDGKKKLRIPMAGAVKAFNDAERTITFVASTEGIDRYGDTIKVDGWDTSAYEKNPVVLWAHDSQDLPVGKCVGIQKQLGQNAALIQKVQFATADENPFADSVYKLYKGGYLNAVSVGFIPKAFEYRFENDGEGKPQGWPVGCDFLEQELLELSCVPVPANAEALALMMKGVDDGLHGAELAKVTIFGVLDKAVEDGAITAEAGEALKQKMAEQFESKSMLVGGATDSSQPSVKPTTQPVQPTAPAPDTDNDGDQAAAPKQPTGEGDPNPGGAPNNEAPAYMADCFKQLSDMHESVKGLYVAMSYAISDEGLKAHNGDVARSLANLHTKVDSMHSKLNGKSIVVDLSLDLTTVKAQLAEAQKAVEELIAKATPVAAGTDEAVVVPEAGTVPEIVKADEQIEIADVIELKSVCPYKKEPLSERDATWDAGKEMGSATDAAAWKRMCTIINGDADLKGSYKLPHHRGPEGKYETVFKGVVAALGRLEQTDASEEDIAGARKHLTKHRAEFGDSFDGVTFETELEQLGRNYRASKKDGSEVLVELFDNMIEKFVEEKASLPELTQAGEGITPEGKDAPEAVAVVPEPKDSGVLTVKDFLASLFVQK